VTNPLSGIDTVGPVIEKTRAKAITVEDAFPAEFRSLLVMATDAEKDEIVASAYRERERAKLMARVKRLEDEATDVRSKADAIAPDLREAVALEIADRMLKAASGVRK